MLVKEGGGEEVASILFTVSGSSKITTKLLSQVQPAFLLQGVWSILESLPQSQNTDTSFPHNF